MIRYFATRSLFKVCIKYQVCKVCVFLDVLLILVAGICV